jgi:hypothetical protein
MHARRCVRVRPIGGDRADSGWRTAVIPAQVLCVGVRPACRLKFALVRSAQIADNAHAQVIQVFMIGAGEIAQDSGAEYMAPLKCPTVACAVAAEIVKIAATFQVEYSLCIQGNSSLSRGARCNIRIRYPRSSASRPIKVWYRRSQAPETTSFSRRAS